MTSSDVPADMRRSYLDNRRTDCQALEQWVKDGLWSEIQQLAHRLRGTAGGYGFEAIGEIATALEQSARSHDTTGCAENVHALCQQVALEARQLEEC